MQKIVLILAISFLNISCTNQTPKEKSSINTNQQSTAVDDKSKIGRNNYAVIWTWVTAKPDLVSHHLPAISEELTNLWKNDVIENAYFDTQAKSDKLGNFANVAFFLKAHSKSEARSVLNELTVVKEGIATYILHPVGQLWLDRKTNLINKKGISNSYVTVWSTLKSPLHGEDADKILKKQSDTILDLWKEGKIENVYFDIEGSYSENEITDFVFFVNATSEEEAKKVCESLPFYKEKMVSYKIHQAGVFWMGQFEDN